MPASTEELIAINSLLIEREAAFAQVHTLESQINQLFGDHYPFEAPGLELPSWNKQKKVKSQKQEKPKDRTIKLRRLEDPEVAYRVTWIDKSETTSKEITDIRSVNTLIQDGLPGLKLVRIETVDLNSETVKGLYSNEE